MVAGLLEPTEFIINYIYLDSYLIDVDFIVLNYRTIFREIRSIKIENNQPP